MTALKNLTRSLHLLAFLAVFLPFLSFEFNGCKQDKSWQMKGDRFMDSLKSDSLIKADYFGLKETYDNLKLHSDSFVGYYKRNRILQSKIDSIISLESLKRVAGRANKKQNERMCFSAYLYLVNINNTEFENWKKDPLATIFVLSIDLLAVLSITGVVVVFVNKRYRYNYLRNISFAGLILCIIIFLIWILHISGCQVEIGYVIFSLLYLTTSGIDPLILKKKDTEIIQN